MDIASLLGTLIAVGLIFFALVFDFRTLIFDPSRLLYYVDFPSLLIVFGGTLAGVLASFPIARFFRLGSIIARVYRQVPEEMVQTLILIIDIAKISRKNPLAIEDALPAIENKYLRDGLQLVVDRVERDLILDIMDSELRHQTRRRQEEADLIRQFATLAPSFGLIGTLIGLVALLQNLNDPSAIGPAMSVSIITTLYGTLAANIFFVPWAKKLEIRNAEEQVVMEMVRDGVLYIERGQRPDFIEQDLLNFLPSDLRDFYEAIKVEIAQSNS